jgi:hypothetical protein
MHAVPSRGQQTCSVGSGRLRQENIRNRQCEFSRLFLQRSLTRAQVPFKLPSGIAGQPFIASPFSPPFVAVFASNGKFCNHCCPDLVPRKVRVQHARARRQRGIEDLRSHAFPLHDVCVATSTSASTRRYYSPGFASGGITSCNALAALSFSYSQVSAVVLLFEKSVGSTVKHPLKPSFPTPLQ